MFNSDEEFYTISSADFDFLQKLFTNPNSISGETEEEVYLISDIWFQQCKVSYESNKTIPPIDNNDLFIEDSSLDQENLPAYFFFNRSKVLYFDFIAVDSKTWTKLYLKYSGGPEFPVPFVASNSFETTKHPVTQFFDIFVKMKDKEHKIVTYNEIKVSELEKVLRIYFKLSEETNFDLIYLNHPLKEDKNLSQQMVKENSHITIQFKSSNLFSSINFPLIKSLAQTSNKTENKPPSPSEQFEIYKTLVKQNPTFCQGEHNANLLSVNWYELWKNIVESHNEDETITPIDNSLLMTFSDEEQKMVPDRSKIENKDFIILHPNVWRQLHAWFGGGPEVTVPVYHNQQQHKFLPVVEFVNIPIDYKDQTKKFEVGKTMPLDRLHEKVREYYKIPKNEYTRLISVNSSNKSLPKTLPNVQNETLYSTNQFYNTTHLILDYKDLETMKWHRQSSTPSSLRESSSLRPIMMSSSNSALGEIAKSDNDEDEDDTDSDHHTFTLFNDNHYSHTYYDRRTEGPGICGLENIGNTCFFNSGIQCLVHTRRLVSYIMDNKYYHDINRSNPIGMHGELAEAFANLTKKIWSGKFNTIRPDEMKYVIGRFAPQFSGYGQQDSHELITFMLDGIHEDLNRVTKKPIVDSINGDGTNDEEIADESWKRYKSRNDSIVIDLFHSQLRSRLVCPNCKKVTVVFDPYMSLQLPISKPNKRKLGVIFVPFDHYEGDKLVRSIDSKCMHLKISILNRQESTDSCISEKISKKLGRKVNAIILYREDRYMGLRICHGLSQNDATHFVLELPTDVDTNKYAIVSFASPKKRTMEYFFTEPVIDIMPPYFVQIPNFGIDSNEFLKCCENYFNFWTGESTELNEKQKIFLDNLMFVENETDHKFQLIRQNDFHLKPWFNNPNIASQVQMIGLASTPNDSFSYSEFLKNIFNLKYFGPLPDSSQAINLDKCFKYFSSNETLDENNKWFCPHCRDFVCADKKMDIWSAPEVLVLQLKRFIRSSEFSMRKLDATVYYPEIIDISKYLAGPQKEEKMIYRLFAVSEHCGSLYGGHYTAHARVSKSDFSEIDGKWYSFNDSYVSRSTAKSAHNSAAYVLFYERIDSALEDQEQSSDSS